MRHLLQLCLIAFATVSGACLFSAQAQETATTTTTSPVAYVYVSRPTHIDGFAASSSGKLTPVPGSPLANTDVRRMSVSKKFLFGESADQGHEVITGFSINSHGSLQKVSSINAFMYEPENGCVNYPDLLIDFTGVTLYSQENPCNSDAAYLSFRIESNGSLQFLGKSGGRIGADTQGITAYLTKMGGNAFAYDGYCAESDNRQSVIDIYKRESNGLLTYIGQDNFVPPGPSGKQLCAGVVAADSENHLAVALQRIDSQQGDNGLFVGPYYLASYAAGSNGQLTTKSTVATMPTPSVTSNLFVNAMSISPSNKYLAVGGPQGFQIFHFNGSSPITKYSGALQTGVSFIQFGWDKANHLYALGDGKLFVYTVTSTSIKQASGSPYLIPQASSLSVLDLP